MRSVRRSRSNAPISHSSWFRPLADLVREESSHGDVIIMGVGHPLRADDYAGSLIAKDLLRRNGPRGKVTVIDAENSPENILHVLWSMKPRLVVLVDSVEAGLSPGSTLLVDLDETTYPYYSTHNIPIRVLLEAGPTIPKSLLLGIQPASHELGEPLSEEVEKARFAIVQDLSEIIAAVRSERNVG